VGHRDRLAELVALVQHGEGRTSLVVNRFQLGMAQSASDVALPERPTGARGEHELLRSGEPRALLVAAENRCQLTWDRHSSGRAVRLSGPNVPVAIDLARELHLGVLQVRDADVRPTQCQELGDTGPGESGQREERAVGLAGSGDRLLVLVSLEQPSLRAPPGLWPLGGQQERDGVGSGPTKALRGIPVDPIHNADDDHDRRLGKPVGTRKRVFGDSGEKGAAQFVDARVKLMGCAPSLTRTPPSASGTPAGACSRDPRT
jgi:hypothetical protein